MRIQANIREHVYVPSAIENDPKAETISKSLSKRSVSRSESFKSERTARSSDSERFPNMVLRVSKSLFATLTVVEAGRMGVSSVGGAMTSGESGKRRRGGWESRRTEGDSPLLAPVIHKIMCALR